MALDLLQFAVPTAEDTILFILFGQSFGDTKRQQEAIELLQSQSRARLPDSYWREPKYVYITNVEKDIFNNPGVSNPA